MHNPASRRVKLLPWAPLFLHAHIWALRCQSHSPCLLIPVDTDTFRHKSRWECRNRHIQIPYSPESPFHLHRAQLWAMAPRFSCRQFVRRRKEAQSTRLWASNSKCCHKISQAALGLRDSPTQRDPKWTYRESWDPETIECIDLS